ncbi:hypothetical protein [Streptomyces nigrescens]
MITRINERTHTPHDPLSEALGYAVPIVGGLTEHAVVAYWPGLDSYILDDEQATWTAKQWAEHLEDPLLEHPFAASPQGDRRAIFHLDARLHPDDRELSRAEWAEAAHRLARAAGIETPGDTNDCHWIAVQGKHGRLDLIANLIHLDGTWQGQPADLLRRLSDEARAIEEDLRLTPHELPPDSSAAARKRRPRQRSSPGFSPSSPTNSTARWSLCAASSSTPHTASPTRPVPPAPTRRIAWN